MNGHNSARRKIIKMTGVMGDMGIVGDNLIEFMPAISVAQWAARAGIRAWAFSNEGKKEAVIAKFHNGELSWAETHGEKTLFTSLIEWTTDSEIEEFARIHGYT